MITGLANLGPSQMVNSVKAEKTEKADFDQILNAKSDKEIRTNFAKTGPVPVEKNLEKWKSQGSETQTAKDGAKNSSIDEPRMAPKEENGREEIESVKSKKVSEKSGKKSKDSSQTREEVMLQFMDSMESEFSIPPVRIAEAMANLSEGDANSSPDDSASQVITQLNLPTDQEQKAYALYMGMLAQLKQVDQQAQAKVPTAAVMASAVPMALSNKERIAQLNNSLDKMNQSFFVKNPNIPQGEMTNQSAQLDKAALPERNSANLFEPKTDQLLPMLNRELPQNYSSMNPMQNLNPQLGGNEMSVMDEGVENEILAGMEKIDPASPEGQKLAKALAALGAAAASLDSSLPTEAAPTANKLQTAAPMNFSDSLKGIQDQGFGEEKEGGDFGSDSGKGDSFFSTHANTLAGHAAKTDVTTQSAAPNFAGAIAMATGGEQNQDSQANIQQIMKQAQYMIKKGGGESKVQMNPEGLGQIHMKVVVNEGKVNLEMTAENKETKKLIENSIGDLKTNLGQHKLSVDSVRVDVGNQASSDNRNSDAQSQQRQMDLRQEHSQNQQRNQTRDFWSQFQDNNNERRAAFMDSPGIRAYGGSRSMDPLGPGSTSAVSQKRYQGSGKGRGIDLVA